MKDRISLPPDFKKLIYEFNDETSNFERVSGIPGFEKVPSRLKIEDTLKPEIIRAVQVIRGEEKDSMGRYKFFTGLKPTESKEFYFGDHFEHSSGKSSFILFQFVNQNRRVTIYYYNHFKVFPQKREKFIQQEIERIRGGANIEAEKKRGETPPLSLF